MFQTLIEIMLLENCLSMKIRNYNTESQGWVNMTLKSTKVDVAGVCNFLGSVSSQQKSEARDQLLDGSVLQLRVTAQFYLENKGKYILEVWEHANPKDVKRKKRESVWQRKRARASERAVQRDPGLLAPLFMCFSSSPWAFPM